VVVSRSASRLLGLALLGAYPSLAHAACGPAGAPTGVQRETVEVRGKSRSYVLSVPDGYRAGTPMPLVFAWHGLGSSGEAPATASAAT
jgi:polyhydroxybutyrate depolymerase